ncbi:competence protein CoiA family protein [Nocardia sp. CDC160]|uniref:competence protein CoiA family protein n=1 Tax=Nocardia sp. CDC160 TaxID=3112166 RepID=UPI002DBE93B4|nr:competence protein CoiA family protein [Nocardia sp. CDC160]MEC3915968.1 competence protein CoiA family protein [Nocardia sp. CDC160]
MSVNNLTVALDIARAEYVCMPIDPADPRMDELRAAGYRGAGTLVCALCFAGVGVQAGTTVPVVVKGRIGGERRPHFAHPPGRRPAKGPHEPESIWHLASKMALATWARTQPDVVNVRTEVWLPNHERRCDVRVAFVSGCQLALEAQASRLTDADWRHRHDDYWGNGVLDVWLWHPESPIPWMVLEVDDHPQQLWMFDPWRESITLMVGAPHVRQPLTSDRDPMRHVQHLPPCAGDDLIPFEFPLSDLVLTPQGIAVPKELESQLADQLKQQPDNSQFIDRSSSALHAPAGLAPAPGLANSRPVPHTAGNRKSFPGEQSLDAAAQAHLDWIILQNALHAAGHVIDYHDAPQLPLPPTKPRAMRCARCGTLCPPSLKPDAVAPCRPEERDGIAHTVGHRSGVVPSGYLGISTNPHSSSAATAIRRGA